MLGVLSGAAVQQWLPFAAASAPPSGRLLRNDQRSGGLCPCARFSPAVCTAPSAFGTETISSLNDLLPGASQDARRDMNPLSAVDVFLTVAIMSAAFLTEVALFILIGMI